jgi:hypothetical protein
MMKTWLQFSILLLDQLVIPISSKFASTLMHERSMLKDPQSCSALQAGKADSSTSELDNEKLQEFGQLVEIPFLAPPK